MSKTLKSPPLIQAEHQIKGKECYIFDPLAGKSPLALPTGNTETGPVQSAISQEKSANFAAPN
jgi:hypothetical protein